MLSLLRRLFPHKPKCTCTEFRDQAGHGWMLERNSDCPQHGDIASGICPTCRNIDSIQHIENDLFVCTTCMMTYTLKGA